MTYVFFIAIAAILFGGFLALTAHEARRGKRYAADRRAAFDATVLDFIFVTSHTDFPAYVQRLLRALAARLAHDAAHAGLVIVRFLERVLTKAVRALRAERVNLIRAEEARQASEFVSQMRDFKDGLRTRKDEVVALPVEAAPELTSEESKQ